MANDKSAPGQQKLHGITNATTGEKRQITQEDWKLNGKALRAEGFTRDEEDTEEVVDPDPTSSGT